jgi:hypothetical protein
VGIKEWQGMAVSANPRRQRDLTQMMLRRITPTRKSYECVVIINKINTSQHRIQAFDFKSKARVHTN